MKRLAGKLVPHQVVQASWPADVTGAIEDQGLGWKSEHSTGFGADTMTGGPEVTWTQIPTNWSNLFFDNLFKYEWEKVTSPAGTWQ